MRFNGSVVCNVNNQGVMCKQTQINVFARVCGTCPCYPWSVAVLAACFQRRSMSIKQTPGREEAANTGLCASAAAAAVSMKVWWLLLLMVW